MSYLFANGGGISGSGNIYVNGIAANTEFNLSGLTVGQKYFLLIDGNGGISSTFYIEGLNGCEVCNTLLPIELQSFTSECMGNYVKVTWTTATEINNNYFELEKSLDAIHWERISKILGTGNSNNPIEYFWDDKTYNTSTENYYRLKQVDFNGKETYSKIISSFCNNELSKNHTVYFNKISQEININFQKEESLEFTLYNSFGELILNGVLQDINSKISLNGLTNGFYILKLGNEKSESYKIIKQ